MRPTTAKQIGTRPNEPNPFSPAVLIRTLIWSIFLLALMGFPFAVIITISWALG